MSAEDNTEDDKPKVEEDNDDQNGPSEQENDKDSPAKTTPKKESKSPSKSPAKTPAKKPVKKEEEKAEEEEEEEEDEDDDDEEDEKDRKVGLLDLPLEVSGARERKKVERLSITYATPTTKKTKDIPEGSGERLGDSPRIEHNISRIKSDDLKLLHRLLFNRVGSASEIKKNIRKFNGFPFETDTPEYEKKRSFLDKLKNADLKSLCKILELERSGTKEELVARVADFILCPKVSHAPAPKSKRSKRSSKSSRGKRKGKSKEASDDSESDEKSESAADESDAEENDNDSGAKTKDDSEADGAEDENTDDEDEEKPVKKTPKTKAKPAAKKKVEKKDTKKAAKKEKKPPAKKAPASKKRSRSIDDDDDDDSDNSDDEPLSKKTKQPPTDDELKALVKSILDGANLEEITMKTVCKQVYAKYPEFDLSDRKEFIKSTVRSIIS